MAHRILHSLQYFNKKPLHKNLLPTVLMADSSSLLHPPCNRPLWKVASFHQLLLATTSSANKVSKYIDLPWMELLASETIFKIFVMPIAQKLCKTMLHHHFFHPSTLLSWRAKSRNPDSINHVTSNINPYLGIVRVVPLPLIEMGDPWLSLLDVTMKLVSEHPLGDTVTELLNLLSNVTQREHHLTISQLSW